MEVSAIVSAVLNTNETALTRIFSQIDVDSATVVGGSALAGEKTLGGESKEGNRDLGRLKNLMRPDIYT